MENVFLPVLCYHA